MTRRMFFVVWLVATLGFSGCTSWFSHETMEPEAQVETTSTFQNDTPNSVIPTTEVTLAPKPTLTTVERDRFLEEMISKPIDCAAPCFWGITPGETTMEDAVAKFRYLNIEPNSTTFEGKTTINFSYDLPNDRSISVVLPERGDVIETIEVGLNLNPSREDKWKDVLAYSPATLINRYGQPTQVGFYASHGPTTAFSMVMYFEGNDLIIFYDAQVAERLDKAVVQLCPLEINYNYIKLWMGEKPSYPPGYDVSLEEVSLLTISEFSNLMRGDPNEACFEVNEDALFGLSSFK